VLAWVQPGTGEQEIWLYGVGGGDYELIAGSDDFAELGQRPAVSDDGAIVVFYGNLDAASSLLTFTCLAQPVQCPDYGATPGPGIFASVKQEDDSRRIIRLTGRGTGGDTTVNEPPFPDVAELGWAETSAETRLLIQFDPNGYDPAQPLGVTNMVDGSFVVSFIAQPTQASRDNPALAGEPLTFSGREGLWALRVDMVAPVGSATSESAGDIRYHPAARGARRRYTAYRHGHRAGARHRGRRPADLCRRWATRRAQARFQRSHCLRQQPCGARQPPRF
jgi:hypothetical protein